MKRPKLTPMRKDWIMSKTHKNPRVYMIMSEGQWDTMLAVAYDMGGVLIELNDKEELVRFYKKIENCGVCGNGEMMALNIDEDNETNVECESCGNKYFDEDYEKEGDSK